MYDDDVLSCVFCPVPFFSPAATMSLAHVYVMCCLLSACLVCADSNSVPVHMVGGSWGSVGKPRSTHKKQAGTDTKDVTQLGEVPIYPATCGGSSQTH